jgi:hypothetical protein
MTGFWYTRREIPLRQCIWYSSLGWGGIIGSYISMGVSTLPANMTPERWELIFFIVSHQLNLVLLILLANSCIAAGWSYLSLGLCHLVLAS